MAVVSENYCDYSDGSWCEISSVNNDDEASSVDSFERVDYDSDEEFLSSMVSNNNVIEKVDDELQVVSTNDLVSKISDNEDAVFDALRKELGLDDEVMKSEKSDKDCVSTDEDGKPDHVLLVAEKTPSSTEDKDYKVLVFEDEDVFVAEKTPKEATRFSPFIQDKYAATEIIPDHVLFGEKPQCDQPKVPTGEEDDDLGQLIKDAQQQLDKKSRTRDLFRAQIAQQQQQQQSRVDSHNDALTAANKKIMAASQLVESKKLEIGYVEDVIKRFRDIVLVEDIDINIRKMEKRIQIECMSLLDEQNLYREISHLRKVRELGSRYEVQEALDRKQHIDDLVKDLKDELKVLQDNLSKAKEAAQAICRALEKDGLVEEEMWAQYKVIQDSREEASAYLEVLKKRLDAKKNGILTHDESKRAHRKEETNKEGIDAVLKDLRDLEKEVCNDASRGATHYSSYPPMGQYSSYPPMGHYSSYPTPGYYSYYPPQGYYSSYPTQRYSYSSYPTPPYYPSYPTQRYSYSSYPTPPYYPSYPPQSYYSSYPTPPYYPSYPPQSYYSSYPTPGYYSSFPTQGHQVTSPVNPTYKPMARKPMDKQKQNVEKAQMQAEQKAKKEAEKREEERLAMERQGQDAKIAQMQAEELAQKKYEQIAEECRQKHDVKKAPMQAEQIEEERLATERQKHDAEKAQMRAKQRAQKETEKKDEENLKPLKERKEKKKAKSRSDGVEFTIHGTTINISRILLEDLIFGLVLMVFFAILIYKIMILS